MTKLGGDNGFRQSNVSCQNCVQECDLRGRAPPRGTGAEGGQDGESIYTRSPGKRRSQISVFSFLDEAKSSRLTQMTSSLALARPPPMPDRAACFLSCVMRDAWLSRGFLPLSR